MDKIKVNPGIFARPVTREVPVKIEGEDKPGTKMIIKMELVEFIRGEPKGGATLGKEKEHVFETMDTELFEKLFSFTNA